MSVTNVGRAGKGSSRSKRAEALTPSSLEAPPVSRPSPSQPNQVTKTEQDLRLRIGSQTLEAVDRLTGMSADEIEVVAERLMEGARETQDILHELARRVRTNGLSANEKLATFINSANKCADTARTMQTMLVDRDRQVADPPPQAESGRARRHGTESPTDLSLLEAEITAIGSDRAPPTQPDDHPEAGYRTPAHRE